MPSDHRRCGSRLSALLILLRNLFIAALFYVLLFFVVEIARSPHHVKGKLGIPAFLDKSGPTDIIKKTSSGVKVKFAASSTSVTINPHANVFNRPKSAVVGDDAYLGKRPHVDTVADLELLVEECRGTYTGLEKMRNVFECLQFLEHGESKYFNLPKEEDRASRQNPRHAEYLDADDQGNTLTHYVDPDQAVSPSKTSRGTCPGPIVPFHTYWTGYATWRLEIFVKSYLYTQNLACSRLYIWLDIDRHPDAIERMLSKDPLFARFLPLVERGDIVLKPWEFPSRIPLPKQEDNTDGNGYYSTPGTPNSKGEVSVADGLIEDAQGQQWLILTAKQMTFLPQAVSDAVRFVVLHLYGGVYLDMDILLLRDMRPLLLPKVHNFAERWAAHQHPGDYNTAVLSLSANSSLSSYLLRGGVRMGLNFHPRVLGRMAWKDGRDRELLMLETAAFDPIWTEFNWDREGRCTVPCFRDYGVVFKGKEDAIRDEWESYEGPQLPEGKAVISTSQIELRDIFTENDSVEELQLERERRRIRKRNIDDNSDTAQPPVEPNNNPHNAPPPVEPNNLHNTPPPVEPNDSFQPSTDEEAELRKAGVILDYDHDEDKYPPNNRTLQNFFRGSWSYHVHNQWLKHPEPSSWMAVIEHAHDGFFAGKRTNPYGERWEGPTVMPYNIWPEFV